MSRTAILLVHCPDRPGIVAAIAEFIYRHGGNILHADQHQDNGAKLFFQRVEWAPSAAGLSDEALLGEFDLIARRFSMSWRVEYSDKRPRVALFVSRHLHCLMDLLDRYKNCELRCEIPLIIGNHPDAAPLAAYYSVPFHLITMENGKAVAESRQLALLEQHNIDLVVLARYMQVLSPAFVTCYPKRIINVHHSFLPAFSGAKPYHAAFQHGVKLIGATSHYVPDELDEGPIIEQDVMRVSHRDQVQDLVRKGRDLERMVLSRGVRWHLEHRILLYGNKTVIFD